MIKNVNIHEAKTHLSRWLGFVAEGNEVTICKAGKPMAKLVPIEAAPTKRKLGLLKEGSKEWRNFIEDFHKIELPEEFMNHFK